MENYDQPAPRNLLVDTARWIVALPAALAAAYVAYLVMGWSVRFGMAYAGIGADSLPVRIADVTLVHGCMGAAFVYAGALLAPCFKLTVSVVMCCLAIGIAAVLGFIAFQAVDWWALAGAVSVAVGAVVTVIGIRGGGMELAF